MAQPSIVALPLSRLDIREYTYKLRKLVGYEGTLEFPIIEFLEHVMHHFDPDFCPMILPKEKMGECHGIARPDNHTIEIREDVYDRAANGEGRDRFTIAHEIGHYFLHGKKYVSYARIDPDKKIPPYKDPEWQANAFAGELLMPSHLIRGLGINEVSQLCKVSAQAASIQLKKQ